MVKKEIIFRYFCFVLPACLFLAGCRSGNRHSATAERSDSVFHSKMLKSVTDSIAKFPDSPGLYFERGGMLYVMKEYDLAEKDIRKAIKLNPVKADYYIALGEIQLAGNKSDRAVNAFRKALQLDPASLMARLRLAYSLFQQEDYRQTIRETDTLLKNDDKLAQAYGLRSQAYQALKDTVKALAVMKKAVALAPGNYDALMALGDLLLSRNSEEALQYYERAGKADTTRGEPLYCIGLFYEKEGQPDKAVTAYRDCIDKDAYYLDAYLKLGGIYEKENAWEKALKIYNLAIQISPVSSDAFYHRGLCFEKLNKIKAAVNDYENAISLKKTNTEAQAALDRLKENNPNI